MVIFRVYIFPSSNSYVLALHLLAFKDLGFALLCILFLFFALEELHKHVRYFRKGKKERETNNSKMSTALNSVVPLLTV